MEQILRCSATKRVLTNDQGAVVFKCPNCMDATIVRSRQARMLSTKYTCPKCGFEGPN